jgi:DNA-binding beta-propeller fold protein YncE
MRVVTGVVAMVCVGLLSVSVLDAQRPSLGSLEERINALDAKPTPEQIAMLRWYPAGTAASFLLDTTPSDIAFDGDHIWVTDRSALVKLRASDGEVIQSASLFSPSGDKRMAFDGAHLWIGDEFANMVLKVRTRDFNIMAQVPVLRPSDVVYDGVYIWVTQNTGGSGSNMITRLLASDGGFQGAFEVGLQPIAAAFDGANIWVANASSHTVTKLRASDGALLATIPSGLTPNGLAFDGTHMWVTHSGSDNIRKIRASDNALVGTFVTGDNPFAIAFDGASMWVANAGGVADATLDTVTKLRASDGANLGTFQAGDNPRSLAFDGAFMWVANRGSISQTPQGSLNKM